MTGDRTGGRAWYWPAKSTASTTRSRARSSPRRISERRHWEGPQGEAHENSCIKARQEKLSTSPHLLHRDSLRERKRREKREREGEKGRERGRGRERKGERGNFHSREGEE